MPLPVLNAVQESLYSIGSLGELDALVGTFLTNEKPRIHWEDSRTHCQFPTVEEALDAMHDLFFREYVSQSCIKPTVLTEIREFRRYSLDLNIAWDVVSGLSRAHNAPLIIQPEKPDGWSVAFGSDKPVHAGK